MLQRLKKYVEELKSQPGKDMVAYGGISFVAALLKEQLIDEIHLFVNPVAIGQEESPFNSLEGFQQLQLQRCVPFPSDIVLLTYPLK